MISGMLPFDKLRVTKKFKLFRELKWKTGLREGWRQLFELLDGHGGSRSVQTEASAESPTVCATLWKWVSEI